MKITYQHIIILIFLEILISLIFLGFDLNDRQKFVIMIGLSLWLPVIFYLISQNIISKAKKEQLIIEKNKKYSTLEILVIYSRGLINSIENLRKCVFEKGGVDLERYEYSCRNSIDLVEKITISNFYFLDFYLLDSQKGYSSILSNFNTLRMRLDAKIYPLDKTTFTLLNVSAITNIHNKFLQLICLDSEFMHRLTKFDPTFEQKLKKIKLEMKSKNIG